LTGRWVTLPARREGNWDLVGNNFPVFFVRDGMSFPDMVHALKPNPKNHIQEGWRIADFFSHHPESMHMVRPLLVCNAPGFGFLFAGECEGLYISICVQLTALLRAVQFLRAHRWSLSRKQPRSWVPTGHLPARLGLGTQDKDQRFADTGTGFS
jgi:hypothetical protein